MYIISLGGLKVKYRAKSLSFAIRRNCGQEANGQGCYHLAPAHDNIIWAVGAMPHFWV